MIRRRTVLLAGSYALVLIVGLAVGAWVAVEQIARATALSENIGTIERLSSYVFAQRVLGDSAAYESALNDYLSSLERRRAKGGLLSDEKVIATDIALTHTRLALLAAKRGDTDGSKKHFEHALAQCPTAFLKSCSVDGLRQVVVALDSKTPGAGTEGK